MARFNQVYIEITNSCNLSCPFCIHNSRKIEFMSAEHFEHILKSIQKYTNVIYLHVLGEPLFHPHLNQLLAIAEAFQMEVRITTNGTLIKEKLPLLLQSKMLKQVNISIHSFAEQKQSNYLSDVLNSALCLSENGINVHLRCWRIQENQLQDECYDYLIPVYRFFNLSMNEIKDIQLAPHLSLDFDESFEWPTLKLPFISEKGTCLGWRKQCAILVDGTVTTCCLDANAENKLGNIFKEDFKQILNQHEQLLIDLRNSKLTLPLCQHCSYRQRFNRR